MRDDQNEVPVPFDVVMLASRYQDNRSQAERAKFAPFCPMLSQGWALLAEGDVLFKMIHHEVRRHLIPALWTTLNNDGVGLIRNAVLKKVII